MQASELFKQSNTVLLDGGMGTMLQASGLKLGAKPEELNITNPELIESIHAKYAAAGSRIVNANTFGASAHKLAGSAYSLEEIIAAGIANCKRAWVNLCKFFLCHRDDFSCMIKQDTAGTCRSLIKCHNIYFHHL